MKDCTCTHTPKHHKQSGRCRKGCDCRAAWVKLDRKLREQARSWLAARGERV